MKGKERETASVADAIVASSSKPMQNGPFFVFISHCDRELNIMPPIIFRLLLCAGLEVIDSSNVGWYPFIRTRNEALRHASLHIAILSRRYIQSPRCLSELSLMLETGKPILPVFYFLEPSELQFLAMDQTLYSSFTEQKNERYSNKKLDEWKNSLARVSVLSGYELNSIEDAEKLAVDIVKDASVLIKDWKSSSISRVRQDLRALRPETFDPKVLGLGVFHHNTSQQSFETRQEEVKALCSMPKSLKSISLDEKVKALCSMPKSLKSISLEEKVKALCTTAKRLKQVSSVHNLINHILVFDQEIRDCYTSDKDSLSKEILSRSLAMDACFILEFFRSEFWFSGPDIEREILADIFKMENQIPLTLLLRILELEFQTHEGARKEAISKLANMLCMQPLIAILPFSLKPVSLRSLQEDFETNINQGACHLLHLLSKNIEAFLKPSNTSRDDTSMDIAADVMNELIDCKSLVMDIDMDRVQEYLIRFKPSNDGQIRFKKGVFGSAVLYLPQIYLSKETEPLFWNLIAFAIGSTRNIINPFSYFMKCIVNLSSQNVGLLKKKKVILSARRDEELHAMFDSLPRDISKSCGPYENTWRKVRDHYGNPTNKRKLWFTYLLFRFSITGFFMLLSIFLFRFSIKW